MSEPRISETACERPAGSWPIRSSATGCVGVMTMVMALATGGVQDPIGAGALMVGGVIAGLGFGAAVRDRLKVEEFSENSNAEQ